MDLTQFNWLIAERLRPANAHGLANTDGSAISYGNEYSYGWSLHVMWAVAAKPMLVDDWRGCIVWYIGNHHIHSRTSRINGMTEGFEHCSWGFIGCCKFSWSLFWTYFHLDSNARYFLSWAWVKIGNPPKKPGPYLLTHLHRTRPAIVVAACIPHDRYAHPDGYAHTNGNGHANVWHVRSSAWTAQTLQKNTTHLGKL